MKLKSSIITAIFLGINTVNSQENKFKEISEKKFDKLRKNPKLTISSINYFNKKSLKFPYFYYQIKDIKNGTEDTVIVKIDFKGQCPACGMG